MQQGHARHIDERLYEGVRAAHARQQAEHVEQRVADDEGVPQLHVTTQVGGNGGRVPEQVLRWP